jgi:hypothetical protein
LEHYLSQQLVIYQEECPMKVGTKMKHMVSVTAIAGAILASSIAIAPGASAQTANSYCATVAEESEAGNLRYAVNTSMSTAEGTASIDGFIGGVRRVIPAATPEIAPQWRGTLATLKQIRAGWRGVKVGSSASRRKSVSKLLAADAKLETFLNAIDLYTNELCSLSVAPPTVPPTAPPVPSVPPVSAVPPAAVSIAGPWAGTGAYLVGRDIPETAVTGGKILVDNQTGTCEFAYEYSAAAPRFWFKVVVSGPSADFGPVTKLPNGETWLHFRNCGTITYVR